MSEVPLPLRWAEELPEGCPPLTATPAAGLTVFRLVKVYPPQADDFDSQRKRMPGRGYPDECSARSVSTYTTPEGCARLRGVPYFKRHRIACINLNDVNGLLLADGKDSHCDWWRSNGYFPDASSMKEVP